MANSIIIVLEDGHGGFTAGQTQTPALNHTGGPSFSSRSRSSSATATGAT